MFVDHQDEATPSEDTPDWGRLDARWFWLALAAALLAAGDFRAAGRARYGECLRDQSPLHGAGDTGTGMVPDCRTGTVRVAVVARDRHRSPGSRAVEHR